MTFRTFYTLHSLTESEERKTLNPDENPVITYKKYKRVKDIEADSQMDVLQKMRKKFNKQSEINPNVAKSFVSVFAMVDARDGEKLKEVSGSWSAEEVELPLK